MPAGPAEHVDLLEVIQEGPGLPLWAGSGPLVGSLYDATGSYRIGFALEIAVLAGAALIILFVRIPAATDRVDASARPLAASSQSGAPPETRPSQY